MSGQMPAVLRDEIARLYREEGKNGREIASMMGLGSTTVYRALQDAGVVRLSSRVIDGPDAEEFVRLYRNGATIRSLAKRYGTSDVTIAHTLDRLGIPRRWTERVAADPENRAEICRRYRMGETQAEIADSYGVHQIVISRVLRQEGVPTRSWVPIGPKHGGWKRGKIKLPDGYIAVWLPPNSPYRVMANSTGYALEHRLVMAEKLGRSLTREETVHHIDGDPANNHPDNLQLRRGKHGKHVVLVCLDCGSSSIGHAPLAGDD